MIKYISILFLFLLLSPSIIESSLFLIGHSHEVCTEDGIHYHDQVDQCDLCLFNSINLKSFAKTLSYDSNRGDYYINTFSINEIVYLSKQLFFSFLERGPPLKA